MKNKILSFILTLAVLMTTPVISCFAFVSYADYSEIASETDEAKLFVTDPELVAKNYSSLAASESAFLDSGYLVGSEHAYIKPVDASLITVDPSTKSVSALIYTDSLGNVWHPVRAVIESDGKYETIELQDGVGTFTCEDTSYSVRTIYELYLTANKEIQKMLVNAAYYLIKSLDNAASADDSLLDIELASGYIGLLAGTEFGTIVSSMSDEGRAAVERLGSQLGSDRDGDGEPDGMLDIIDLIEIYESASSKTAYLMTYGTALRSEIRSFRNDIISIAGDERIVSAANAVSGDPAKAEAIGEMLGCFAAVSEKLGPAAEDEWNALDHKIFKDGLTSDEYEDVDCYLEEVVNEYEREEKEFVLHTEEIKNPLWGDSAIISNNVERCTLTVMVGVNAISPMTVDSTELTSLGSNKISLDFKKGTSAADIYAELELAQTEQHLLGMFDAKYNINAVNYERTANTIPDQLNENAIYYIEYNPKLFPVTFNYQSGIASELPYAYNMTLPECPTNGRVYNYDINGGEYTQSEVYTIVGTAEADIFQNGS